MHTKAHIAIFIALQCIKSLLFYPLLCVQRSSLFSWCVSINGYFGVSMSKWDFFLSFQKDFDLLLVGLENREKLKGDDDHQIFSSSLKSFNAFAIHEYFLMLQTRRSRSGNTSSFCQRWKPPFSDPLIKSCLSTNGIQFWTSYIQSQFWNIEKKNQYFATKNVTFEFLNFGIFHQFLYY